MASNASHKSRWIETYKDKSDEWLTMRLKFYEAQELASRSGSKKRREEIRSLRVELRARAKAAAPSIVVPTGARAAAPQYVRQAA